MTEFTEQDAIDLQQINWLAKADYRYKKLCYDRVKTPLIQIYGESDGFDLQYFERRSWDDDDCEPHSCHRHILARFRLGGLMFHQPTDEFEYWQPNSNISKKSPRFDEFRALCKEEPITGIAEKPADFDKGKAVRALRRLVHKFKPVLRKASPKSAREDFPFVVTQFHHYFKTFSKWQIRVPNEIAVCGGCGGKLTFSFDNLDLEWWLEDRRFARRTRAVCDSYRFDKYKRQCAQSEREWHSHFRPLPENEPEPWTAETELVKAWLPGVLPNIILRDLGKVKTK